MRWKALSTGLLLHPSTTPNSKVEKLSPSSGTSGYGCQRTEIAITQQPPDEIPNFLDQNVGLCISYALSENHPQILSGSTRNPTELPLVHTHGNLTLNLRSADRNDSNHSGQATMDQQSLIQGTMNRRQLNLDLLVIP